LSRQRVPHERNCSKKIKGAGDEDCVAVKTDGG